MPLLPVPISTDGASKNVAPFVSADDTQIDALRAVLGANVRVALDDAHDRRSGGIAVAETFGYPVTLELVRSCRLPALSVWRTQNAVAMQGKQRQRRSTFMVRWWLAPVNLNRIGEVWPMLNLAFEVVVETLIGNALLDIAELNDDGEVVRIPSSSVLGRAGFLTIDRPTIQGGFDYATSAGGTAGHVFPVMDVSFEAVCRASSGSGGYLYPGSLDDLDELTELFATILSAEVQSDGTVESRPFVEVLARTDGDRSTQSNDALVTQPANACETLSTDSAESVSGSAFSSDFDGEFH